MMMSAKIHMFVCCVMMMLVMLMAGRSVCAIRMLDGGKRGSSGESSFHVLGIKGNVPFSGPSHRGHRDPNFAHFHFNHTRGHY